MTNRLACAALLALSNAALAGEPPADLSVRELFSNPAFSSPRISPDGKQVAVLVSDGDTQGIGTRPLAGGKITIRSRVSSPETRFSWLTWAKPDVLWVGALTEASPRSFFRGHFGTVISLSLVSGEMALLGFAPRVLHWLPSDPEHVLVSWGEGVTRIRAVDGKRDGGEEVPRRARVRAWHADASGGVRAGEALQGRRYDLLLRETPDADFEVALSWNRIDGSGPRFLGFHDDANKVYVVAPHEGRDAVFTFDRVSKQLALVHADPTYDVDALIEEPSTGRNLATSWIADAPKARWFDAKTEQEFAELRAAFAQRCGQDCNIEDVGRDRSGRIAILAISSDVMPPEYFIYDRARGAARSLIAERHGLSRDRIAESSKISIVARDGLKLPAYLTLPRHVPHQSLPLIVMPHGGPASRDWLDWNPEAQLFASRGIAVLRVNFRGSTGYGEAFERAGHREWGDAMQNDLTDAVSQLAAKGIVDADRVGIYGASYGGFAALAGLVVAPEVYRAGAAYAAVTDLPSLLRERARFSDVHLRSRLAEEIGSRWEDREELREVSPRRRAADIRVPVLLGHGEIDVVVGVDHSRAMATALRKAGKPFEYLEFPHEIHGFLLEANRVRWYEALIAFFEKNLAPRATQATAAAEPEPAAAP